MVGTIQIPDSSVSDQHKPKYILIDSEKYNVMQVSTNYVTQYNIITQQAAFILLYNI